jgi:putative transposase
MSAIQRAYKTELALNDQQITACKKHAGAARWAYTWGLARKQEAYRATGKSPTAINLQRELKALKPTAVPWMYEVSKCAPQEALRNLDNTFAHGFRRAQLTQPGKRRGKAGDPQRKTRKRGLGAFRLTDTIIVFPDAIQLPRLGRLRLKERGCLPTTDAHILSATVREQATHGSVAVLVQPEPTVPVDRGPVVGVDLGIERLATHSDGTEEPTPRHLRSCLTQLKRYWARSRASATAFAPARRRSAHARGGIAGAPRSVPLRGINSPIGRRKPSPWWEVRAGPSPACSSIPPPRHTRSVRWAALSSAAT